MSVCLRGKTVTVDGHHGLSRRFGTSRHSRHNQVNDLLCMGTLATREPHSLYTKDNKRDAGAIEEEQVPRQEYLPWHIRSVLRASQQ